MLFLNCIISHKECWTAAYNSEQRNLRARHSKLSEKRNGTCIESLPCARYMQVHLIYTTCEANFVTLPDPCGTEIQRSYLTGLCPSPGEWQDQFLNLCANVNSYKEEETALFWKKCASSYACCSCLTYTIYSQALILNSVTDLSFLSPT